MTSRVEFFAPDAQEEPNKYHETGSASALPGETEIPLPRHLTNQVAESL